MSAAGLAAKQTEEADRRITRKAWEEAPATRYGGGGEDDGGGGAEAINAGSEEPRVQRKLVLVVSTKLRCAADDWRYSYIFQRQLKYRVPPAVPPRQACYESQCMSQQLIAMCEARGFKVPVHMPHPPLSIYMSLYQRAYELRFFPNK
ncbi:hypothetical protein DY000_02045117 [Brassica cretica]|uniref:Uncharacterized protein n=1 Tax=Brassica cretica TaxID=69181 RepID=A0ABQ7CNX7_BRACR|nr:hypothetical protein DY000_02012906 [Brassica cretica]KAF3612199.1 hypothetical protein DY000_02045117 [Brassica cretica]